MSFIVDSVLILALILIYVDNRLLRTNLIDVQERVIYWNEQIAGVIIDQGNLISDVKNHADELDELRSMLADSDRGIQTLSKYVTANRDINAERFSTFSTRLDNHFNMIAGSKDEIRYLYDLENRIRDLELVWCLWLLNVKGEVTLDQFVEMVAKQYDGIDSLHEKQDPGVASELECGSVDAGASEGYLSEGTKQNHSGANE